MFLAINLEINIAIGIESSVVAIIVIKIKGRCAFVRVVICEIAKAVPLLDFWKRISVIKETAITIVLIEPRSIKNSSWVDFPDNSDAIIAAWLEPSPGKREQIGEINMVAIVGLMIWDFEIWSFSIFCLGRIILDFIE